MEAKKAAIILIICTAILSISVSAQESAAAQGGNITPLFTSNAAQTARWDGFVGTILINSTNTTSVNSTGGNISELNVSTVGLCDPPINITGFVFFSNSTGTIIATDLVAGNLSLLQSVVDGNSDSASATFNTTSSFTIDGTTITGVPTLTSFVNSTPQSSVFREGYFNDGSGNLIFAVEIDFNTVGYNISEFDYQAILPTLNTSDLEFFITSNIDVNCTAPFAPAPVFVGGGGRGYRPRCTGNWTCDHWSACERGLQRRDCNYFGGGAGCIERYKPSKERECRLAFEQENLTEQEIIDTYHLLGNLTLDALEIRTTPGVFKTLSATTTNNARISEESLYLDLETPIIYQQITPLHTNPLLYNIPHSIPFPLQSQKLQFEVLPSETFRLSPNESQESEIHFTTPIIEPQTVRARVQLKSADIIREVKPIEIKVDSAPFSLMARRRGNTTTIIFMIDNTGKPARTTNVELNLNSEESTKFAELYTLKLPEDDFAVFGHNYRTPYNYDTAIARFEGEKFEVIDI